MHDKICHLGATGCPAEHRNKAHDQQFAKLVTRVVGPVIGLQKGDPRPRTPPPENRKTPRIRLVSKRDSPGVIRARPILLTTLAVVLGSAIKLTDSVFGGLAISLIFGTFASSALTIIIMVPVFHYRAKRGNMDQIDRSGTFVSLPEAKS